MKKILSLTLVICTILCVFTGCSIGGDTNKPDGSNVASVEYKKYTKSAEDVAEYFIECVIAGKYKEILDIINVEDKTFITGDDISYILPRTQYADFVRVPFEKYKIEVTNEYDAVDVQYDNSGATATERIYLTVVNKQDKKQVLDTSVLCEIGDDGWYVNIEDLYAQNYTFYTPGGNTKCYIDDIEVTKDYLISTAAGNHSLYNAYCIPFIGQSEKSITVKSENFEHTEQILAVSDNSSEPNKIIPDIDNETAPLEAVMNLFNKASELYEIDAQDSEYLALVSSNANSSVYQIIKSGIASLYNDATVGNYTNIRMTNCLVDNEYGIFWVTNDVVCVNYKYELTWNHSLGNDIKNMHYMDYSYLQLENGEYKFYNLGNNKLFSWINYYSDKW